MAAVAQLGCIACRRAGIGATPAEVHHKRFGVGAGQRASHFDTMPLCPGHHRHYHDAIHKSPRLFVQHYGTEDELIEQTRKEVGIFEASKVGNSDESVQ